MTLIGYLYLLMDQGRGSYYGGVIIINIISGFVVRLLQLEPAFPLRKYFKESLTPFTPGVYD